MKRHFRLFALYFAQYAKVRLAYKADFFIVQFSTNYNNYREARRGSQ